MTPVPAHLGLQYVGKLRLGDGAEGEAQLLLQVPALGEDAPDVGTCRQPFPQPQISPVCALQGLGIIAIRS